MGDKKASSSDKKEKEKSSSSKDKEKSSSKDKDKDKDKDKSKDKEREKKKEEKKSSSSSSASSSSKEKERPPKEATGKDSSNASSAAAAAGDSSMSAASSPPEPTTVLMVPSGIAGHSIPVTEAYRQKLEWLMNHINTAVMPVSDAIGVHLQLTEASLGKIEDTRQVIVQESQEETNSMVDRLEASVRWRASEYERLGAELRRYQDEIHRFITKITTPCSLQQQMLEFVNRYEELRRECDFLARRPIRSIPPLRSENMLNEFPREMREMKAKSQGYDALKKMLQAKDALIAQLLQENTELRQLFGEAKHELQQWMATAAVVQPQGATPTSLSSLQAPAPSSGVGSRFPGKMAVR